MQMCKNEKSYVGIDVGKKSLEVVRYIKTINKPDISRFKCKNTAQGRSMLINWLIKTDIVALETGNTGFLIAKLILKSKKVQDVFVLNAGRLKMIYQSLKKTDKEDSLKIARLISGYSKKELPIVNIPSDDEEELRSIVSAQEYYKNRHNQIINRMHSLFHNNGITDIKKSDLKNVDGREILANRLKKFNYYFYIGLIKELEVYENNMRFIAEDVKQALKKNIEITKKLFSIPGFGPKTAMAFLAYIGNGDRFYKAKQVAYYSGLTPRIDMSGQITRYGRIVKGCHQIKRVIIQAAWASLRSKENHSLKKKYYELIKSKSKSKAIVAIARKMVELAWTLLKKNEIFSYCDEIMLNKKLKFYKLI